MGMETWLLLATLVVLAWLYSRWRHSYWSSRGVPSPTAVFFIGHFHKSIFAKTRFWEDTEKNYKEFYSSSMYGIYEFFKPVLVTWNSEVLKEVFMKNFDHFTDRRKSEINTGHDRDNVSLEMLVQKQGAAWKSLRAIMTPTFTSGMIKSMFPLVCDKANALVKFSMKQASENPHVDMRKNFGRYTMDTIASCAFGLECNSFEDETAEFLRKADAFVTMPKKILLKGLFFLFMPKLFKWLGLSLCPPEMDFFVDVVKQTVAARRVGLRRGDFLDLLLEARDNSDNLDSKHVLNDLSLVAQSVLFLLAGYESTAFVMATSSFLLAKNKDQQKRLRDEVRQIVAEYGDLTYQNIMEATLLDACLQETLRLYPPGLVLERVCTKTYTLPGSDLTLKPGDMVQVPVWSLHHDPRHWPDPEAFIPDRFLPENKGDIHPFSHLPFGVGPRNCIAMRFALMEAKVALAKLLLEAELEPAPGHEELVLDSNNGILRIKNGVMLALKSVREK